MTRFVIDAPTLIYLVTERLEVHATHRLVAPNAIRSQALTLLLGSVRCGEMAEKKALALEEEMTGVALRLLGDRVSRRTAWKVAREQNWDDLVDAEYVAVTRLQADALVSVDPDVARGLRTLVPVEPVRALSLPPRQ